jgi:hypothetical protein
LDPKYHTANIRADLLAERPRTAATTGPSNLHFPELRASPLMVNEFLKRLYRRDFQ